ncbi:hypothetical protein BT69DRAFT_1336064 [Atractiella rhizophila]|nr:hypothetical protein BT69DRAFT_1336064 [Atractiella rhizophila]
MSEPAASTSTPETDGAPSAAAASIITQVSAQNAFAPRPVRPTKQQSKKKVPKKKAAEPASPADRQTSLFSAPTSPTSLSSISSPSVSTTGPLDSWLSYDFQPFPLSKHAAFFKQEGIEDPYVFLTLSSAELEDYFSKVPSTMIGGFDKRRILYKIDAVRDGKAEFKFGPEASASTDTPTTLDPSLVIETSSPTSTVLSSRNRENSPSHTTQSISLMTPHTHATHPVPAPASDNGDIPVSASLSQPATSSNNIYPPSDYSWFAQNHAPS